MMPLMKRYEFTFESANSVLTAKSEDALKNLHRPIGSADGV